VASTRHKLRIGIIFGGRSSEHEVSLNSAISVITYLDKEKYDITPIGITKSGQWIAGMTPTQLLQEEQRASKGDQALTAASLMTELSPTALSSGLSLLLSQKLDVIFPVLHGTYGEDGTVQGFLELANIPYVGCGVLGSALGMDKEKMKALFRAVGLLTVETFVCQRSELRRNPEQLMDTIEHHIGYPCFTKPANGGSSIGISKVYNRTELAPALQLSARYDAKLVVERAIDCRELSCAVIGNDNPMASLIGEAIFSHDFYDYRAKYLNNTSYTIVPADVPKKLSDEMRFQALQAFRALDLSGLARVDFFLETKTGQILINEVNTFPSFTEQCLYPKLCETIGLPYPLLLEYLIDLARERHADRQQNDTCVHLHPFHTNLTSQSLQAQSIARLLPERDINMDAGREQQPVYQCLPC
jgi:D-alanine-D-alanine ligase